MNNQLVCFFVFNSRKFLLSLLLVSVSVFSSCKHQRKLTSTNKCILEYKNSRALTTNLKANEFHFDRLNAKLSVETMIDSTYNSFSISLRIKKDSLMWMSISKLGIEGVRVLITKDSVKFFSRIGNNYFKGDFSYFSNILNTQVDFEILQSLLIGNSVAFYNDDEKIKPGVDNCQYTLGTIRKYKLRKVMGRGKEMDEPVQSIYMDPSTFKIARILFYDFNPPRSLDAHFDEFTAIDSTQLFPLKISYSIKAQKNIGMTIHYNKPRLNEEQSFPFKIPDNYERIIYKEKQ
jgi:hypothetical protein